MTDFPSIQWIDAWTMQVGLKPACHVQIQNNAVVIEVDLEYFDPKHFTNLVMRAYDTVRGAVDLLSFTNGTGFTFLLETWTDPEGATKPLAAVQPELAALSTSVATPANFSDVLRIVVTDPPLFMALRDLIEAITQWHQAPITAARAIERLRHSVAPNETVRKKQWDKLGDVLQLHENYTKIIRETSIGPRHGDPTHIPGTIISEVALRAWVIMNRYLEFRKRGGTNPLPASEFPLLT
jgi:hypothetical protein